MRISRRFYRSSIEPASRKAAIGRPEISALWIPGVEGIESVARYEELGVARPVVPTPAIVGSGHPVGVIQRFVE